MCRAWLPIVFAAMLSTAAAPVKDYRFSYLGKPYQDSRHFGSAQTIPGRIECALYDLGGEGVAYHDSDAKNNGSGTLNPVDGTYLNEFRMHEGVDISYTKFNHDIDNTQYNFVLPPENQLYVGWTVPGEWFNITIDAPRAGLFAADLLFTSNHGGVISLDVDDADATGLITIPSTFNASDPIAWRQFHHWNIAPALVKLRLAAGRHVLTVHIVNGGDMNLATLDFKPVS